MTPAIDLGRQLDSLLATQDAAAHRSADPVSFVHRQRRRSDREVVGLIASSLAFGNVVAIRRSVGAVLERLAERPADAIDRRRSSTLARRLEGFVHRTFKGADVAAMLANAGRVRRRYGSLEGPLREGLDAGLDLREALAVLADALRGPTPSRGLAHLIPDPRRGSACKRLLLYLRWMVRPADGVDLGLWSLPASALVIPVDTHVLRIARNLGLTERRDASWRTAVEITDALRRYDADDPVKYDFAICHFGVSRACPSQRDPEKCATCVLRPHCRHWTA